MALDVGSSTRNYRLARQPHIERHVLAPLRERGIELASLDAKWDEGIDYVADITTVDFDVGAVVGRRFDLVLCNNVLVHVSDVSRGASVLPKLVAPGGFLLVSSPQSFRRVPDPLDNGFRPSPSELAEVLTAGSSSNDLELLRGESVRIDNRSDYLRSPLRPSCFRLAGAWIPVPGALEQLRYVVKSLRWRVSCVLMRSRHSR